MYRPSRLDGVVYGMAVSKADVHVFSARATEVDACVTATEPAGLLKVRRWEGEEEQYETVIVVRRSIALAFRICTKESTQQGE